MADQLQQTSDAPTVRTVAAASAGDQFLSSLSNFLLVLPVVALSPQAAGLVAVTSAVNAITLAALQALLHEPLLIESARRPAAALLRGHGVIVGAMIACSLTLLLGVVTLGGSGVAVAVAAIAVCVAQDAVRLALIARNRIPVCLVGDLSWVLVTAVLLAGQWHSLTARDALLSWAGGGAASIVVLLLSGRMVCVPGHAADVGYFLRGTRGFRLGLLSEMIIGQGVAAVPIIGLTAAGQPVSAALYRLAQSLLGPVGVVISSTRLWLYPRIVGQHGTRAQLVKVERAVLAAGVGLTALASIAIAVAPLVHITFAARLSWVLVALIGLQLSVSASYAPSVMSIRVGHGAKAAAKVRLVAGSVQALGALAGLAFSADAIAGCTVVSSVVNRYYVRETVRKLTRKGQT